MRFLSVGFLIVLLTACQPASQQEALLPLAATRPSGCNDSRPVLHRVQSVAGIVGYYGSPDQWTVSYALPGTYDSQWTGLVCNLPETHRVAGKQVRFSGEFRDARGEFPARFGGQEVYYLYLTAITER